MEPGTPPLRQEVSLLPQPAYNEAQEICVEDSTKICIASPMKYFVSSTSVQGFAPSAADASDFRDTYLTQ